MKVSLDWIQALLDRPLDAEEAERVLTNQGFPIDGIETVDLADGRSETVLDVEVTSNRSDCLSHVGVARELAAGTGRTLRCPDTTLPAEADTPAAELTAVRLDDPARCPAYSARVIRGVRVGPSPDWLARRLETLGLRPVNNVVDVTNYVLVELGQPLHAFDMAKLAEGRIVVRGAEAGEAFTAIDGTKHVLSPSVLVIADARRPQAVAGVMGGLDSEVTRATTDVLLESARFDPVAVRRASRGLKLASDSSYRFERGIDPAGVELASRRAARLIVELAGGALAAGVVREGEPHEAATPRAVSMRAQRCADLLGDAIPVDEQSACLDKLGLSPTVVGNTIECTVPTFRLDLEREVDLIEEVARVRGLDATPMLNKMAIVTRLPQPSVEARRQLARVLIAHGYHETVTPSFLPTPDAEAFAGGGAAPLTLADERRKAEPALRTAVLPSLLRCRKTNQDVGNRGVRLFELAHVWAKRGGETVETARLAMLADVADDREAALRAIKGAVVEAVEALGGPDAAASLAIEPRESRDLAPGAALRLGDGALGTLGLASSALLDRYDLQSPVVVAELDAALLLSLYPPHHEAGALPRFPAVERDLSIVLDDALPWREVEQAIRAAGPAHLEALEFVGTYRGKPIPKGRKSVSLRLRFRRHDATLTGDAVDAEVARVVAALGELGAELRQ